MTLTARDAMVRLGDCIRGDDSLLDAARRMTAQDANAMAVVDGDGGSLGVLASVDVVRAVAGEVAPAEITVAEVLAVKGTVSVVVAPTIEAEASLQSVLSSMREHRADILTVEKSGEPIGLVRRGDVESYSYEPPDGLPLPPPDLIELVSGLRSARVYRSFYGSGARSAETVRSVLERNGARVDELSTMLDFGCGCGRVIRHWRDLDGVDLFGSDYNARLIDWCKANLPFARFQSNGLAPELEYPDSAFDLVYAFSVFTHFDAELQGPWLAELRRVVRTGGLVLLTLHGLTRAGVLESHDRDAFLAGELVVHSSDEAGSNVCAAFHPESYVRDVMGAELELLELTPNGAPEIGQDVALFRKSG
jgi:SAM-dependent methyltransferase/predicted transcriptional regulator